MNCCVRFSVLASVTSGQKKKSCRPGRVARAVQASAKSSRVSSSIAPCMRGVLTLATWRQCDQSVASFCESQVDHWRVRRPRCLLPYMDMTLPLAAVRSFRQPRFERVAITSVFGNPREQRTWSGAPANVAKALERLGVIVQGIQPRISRMAKARVAVVDMMAGRGRPLSGEQVLRSL